MVIVNKKKASSTLYFIFFLIIFLAFCAFAVDGTIVFTNRVKLQSMTETAALAAAEMFNSDSDPLTISASERGYVQSVANDTFASLQGGSLKYAKVDDVILDPNNPILTLKTSMISQPLFLSFLGVSGINLEAQAKAQSEQLSVYGVGDTSIHWATKRATYSADVIENDTVILKPLGDFASASFVSGKVNYKLISSYNSASPDPLSLGPGGFITIKLPAPIINKTGPDLQVIESGAREGYMVFAGLDNDPNNPYIDNTDTGGGISWVNISCTGNPVINGDTSHGTAMLTNLGQQGTFYGSGNFDLDNHCAGGISMIKYIRIIDDNEESGYIQGNGNTKVMLYGESSSPTPGADIDVVKVLNYVHLTS